MSEKSVEVVCLQNILHPGNAFSQEEQVYFHRNADGMHLDLDGYFNLFYIEKHKKYTTIAGISIKLRLKGVSKVTLMHDRDEIETFSIDDPASDSENTFAFPYDKFDKGVFWVRFRKAENSDCMFDGYFFCEVSQKRAAKVLIDICTYKREKYVLRNMEHLAQFMDDPCNLEYAQALEVAIVDNGRTLDSYDDLTKIIDDHKYITVYPNPNTGGAGGFTRGMKEALLHKEEKGFTHVLLMDDDASFNTEMFVRLFGVLWTLRDEYKDITVGGAIFREDYTYIQFASGEWYEKLEVVNNIRNLDMRSYAECTQEEMCSTAHELNWYSGWWCCCYSLNVVTMDNLPLSLFVHYDDIEYEVRNRQAGNPVMFVNGFGVWHTPFEGEFQRAKIYYNARNKLIYATRRDPEAVKLFFDKILRRDLSGCLMNHRYLDMHLIYMGVKDFLKGMEWLESLDFEEFHRGISAYVKENTKNITIDDFDRLGISNAKEEAEQFISNGITDSEIFYIRNKPPRRVPLIEKLMLNGSLFPMKKGAVVITTKEGLWEKGFGYRKYVFVEKNNDKIMYVEHDPKEFWTMIKMYLELKKLYKNSKWVR